MDLNYCIITRHSTVTHRARIYSSDFAYLYERSWGVGRGRNVLCRTVSCMVLSKISRCLREAGMPRTAPGLSLTRTSYEFGAQWNTYYFAICMILSKTKSFFLSSQSKCPMQDSFLCVLEQNLTMPSRSRCASNGPRFVTNTYEAQWNESFYSCNRSYGKRNRSCTENE